MGFCALGRSYSCSCWERGRRLLLLFPPLLLLLLEESDLSCWVGRRPVSDVSSFSVVRMLWAVGEAKGRRGVVLMVATRKRWVAEVTEVNARGGEGEACRKAVVAAVPRSRTRVQERARAQLDVAVALRCMVLDEGWARGAWVEDEAAKRRLRMVLLWTIL